MSRQQMIPTILDGAFNRIAEIDDFISFIWTTRYYTSGDFELCADISRADLLQVGNYVQRKNDDHLGIIETVKYQMDEDRAEMVIASGRFLPALLARRVISQQTQVSGLVTECIKTLINENAITPSDTGRTIPGLTFTNRSANTQTMDSQYTGENLLDTVSKICETYGVGFDCVLGDNNDFDFILYDGTDRSYNQNTKPFVIFSDKYDNLLSSEYNEDFKSFVTDVLVGGEGEGVSRTMIWSAKSTQTGLNRYEKFMDASSAVTNENIITQATYEKQLEGLGLEQVTEYTTAFTGEVDFTGVELGKDIFVGDICTIENTKWQMFINSRLVEAIESIDESGAYSAVPTFGT